LRMSILGLHFNICNPVLVEILKAIWFFIVKFVGNVSRLFGIEGDTRVILGGMLNLLPVCFMGICMKNYKAVQSIPFWHLHDVFEWR
jgi:hypothetical protein